MRIFKIKEFYFPKALPLNKIFQLVTLWIFTAVINALLLKLWNIDTGVPLFFPISIFSLSIDSDGILFAILFLAVISFALSRRGPQNLVAIYAFGLLLLVLGNLTQGNIDAAFLNPISGGDGQYFHDAIQVGRWTDWIRSFNASQEYFVTHSRTHPPGAVLIEKLFMYGETALSISLVFSFIASISIVLVYKMFIVVGKDRYFACRMALLYSVVPAVNIYSVASLDAVIATLFNMCLLGVLILSHDKKHSYSLGASLVVFGLLVSSFLTFAVLFLWAVIFVYAVIVYRSQKNIRIIYSYIAAATLFIIIIVITKIYLNYDYIESFMTASRLENEAGFMLFVSPVKYLATRIENVYEIALFLSVGTVSVLMVRDKFEFKGDMNRSLATTAIIILGMMFLTGAFKTGETARACLFIVSYILILLKDINSSLLGSLISLAALQTIIMQQMGNYFW